VLKKYDFLITSLARNRQRQGLKPRSPRYDRLVDNLREFMKNEINRVLNRAVLIHKPAELIIERLDFRSPNLSRRMNRLIAMFGKSVVNNKLDSLRLSLGIKITETNPAYSSQECSVCGYVDKGNRVSQSQFKCKCCNTGIHADVNGARIHHARSSDTVIDVYRSAKSVLPVLTERFLSDRERRTLHSRMAPGLLSSNPYFAGPSAQPKGFL
jgi:putative transposase